ncbi:hypothetical protein AB1Y20_012361 [Prymnesium parvum]|uniref:Phospholipase B-like n=1 Tax=Prymnesium parvum TaxID=97485 RepID=A0AB34IQD5_PRYPA
MLEDKLTEVEAMGIQPPWTFDQLVNIAYEKKAGQSQSKKSANVLEATAISTDNPHLWDVMSNEKGKTANMLTAAPSQPEAPPSVAVLDSVKEVCPTFKTAEGRVRSAPRLIMVDGGSNINLFNNKAVPSLGIPLPGAPVQVSGWSDSVPRCHPSSAVTHK